MQCENVLSDAVLFIRQSYELSNGKKASNCSMKRFVLSRRLFDTEIHQNIAIFDRCFVTGSIAGSSF